MTPVLARLGANPHIQAACSTVLAEIATKGVADIYHNFMDMLAHKIANNLYIFEQEEKERKKDGV
jgi:hypothetical protein